MSDSSGAQAYLESLRAENTMMEHEIKRMENATEKDLVERQKALSQRASRGIKILSWDPPVMSEAGVDNGAAWRPPQTSERKKDGSMFVGS
eukprot:scaffold6696_cov146-Isochrysis_galbana.AAC.2